MINMTETNQIWIDVNIQMPEKEQQVLIYGDDDIFTGQWSGTWWHINCRCREGSAPYKVSHWAMLPQPPEIK
jgi:uncharacterized protein DUF551